MLTLCRSNFPFRLGRAVQNIYDLWEKQQSSLEDLILFCLLLAIFFKCYNNAHVNSYSVFPSSHTYPQAKVLKYFLSHYSNNIARQFTAYFFQEQQFLFKYVTCSFGYWLGKYYILFAVLIKFHGIIFVEFFLLIIY